MLWVRSPVYFYKNETFYFRVRSHPNLLHRFNKWKIEVSLRHSVKLRRWRQLSELLQTTLIWMICLRNRFGQRLSGAAKEMEEACQIQHLIRIPLERSP